MKDFSIIKNKTARGFVRVTVFILVFVLLLEGLSQTVYSKANAMSLKNVYANSYSFSAEPKDSIQVACIGNSDLYSGFVPTTLWEEYGYTSSVLASPRQTTAKSYELLKDVLKNQKPNILVLETDMFYKDTPKRDKDGKTAIKVEQNDLDFLFDYLDVKNFADVFENHFSIFLFHDNWKKIGQHNDKKTANTHGYKFNTDIKIVKKEKYMVKTDDSEPLTKENLLYIDKIVNLCKENDINVVLLEMPSVNSWSYERHNAVDDLAQSYGIEFVDLNLVFDEFQFDPSKDFRDKGNHMNYTGACKSTKYLGKMFAEKYNLDDRRADENYQYWNDNLELFKEEKLLNND